MPPPKRPVIENVGLFTFFPIAVSAVAYVFGTVGTLGCRMLSILPTQEGLDANGGALPNMEAGFYAYRDGLYWSAEEIETVGIGWANSGLWDPCRPYRKFDYEEDGYMSALQVLSVVVCVLGGICVLGIMSAPCFPIHEYAWKVYGVMFFILGILQAFTMQVFNTNVCLDNPRLQYLCDNGDDRCSWYVRGEEGCVIERGWRFALTATILWFFVGLVTLKTPAPRKKQD